MALSRRTGQRFESSIWPGFVDAMTGLLLVMMFLLTIFMVVQFTLRETISGQETELDVLSSEVSALASALGLEERRGKQLEARMGALNSTLNQTQTDLDTARNNLTSQSALIASLTTERDRQIGELELAQTQITGFEAQVASLLTARDRALGVVADLEQERTQLQADQAALLSEQDALNAALTQSRGEIDLQAEAARLAAARREALEVLIADLRQEGADQSEAASGRIETLENQLGEEEAARLVEAAAAEALRDRLQNADAELTAMTLALEAQRQDAEDTLTLLAAAEAAREDLDAKLLAALGGIENAQAQTRERDELAERLTRVLAQMEAAQSTTVQTMNALEGELDRLRAQSARTEAALASELLSAKVQTEETRVALEAELAKQRALSVQTQSLYDTELLRLKSEYDKARRTLEGDLLRQKAQSDQMQLRLETEIARLSTNYLKAKRALEAASALQLTQNSENLDRYNAELAQLEIANDVVREQLETSLAEQKEQTLQLQARYESELADLRATSADAQRVLEAELALYKRTSAQSETSLSEELARVRSQNAEARRLLEADMAQLQTEADSTQRALQAELAQIRSDSARQQRDLEVELAGVQADLAAARGDVTTTSEDRAAVEARLLKALEAMELAQAAAFTEKDALRARLIAALAEQERARQQISEQMSLGEQRATLLAAARKKLSEQEGISLEAQRQTELLNLQIAALRNQLGGLQALLDESSDRDTQAKIQLQTLGSDLNTALARAASEERKRRQLEAAARKRAEAAAKALADEARKLQAQTKDLEKYRSEFFGKLREVLGTTEGVSIQGDRFVFSSEVLFAAGAADLSLEGEIEIAKIADILLSVIGDIPPEIDWVIQVDGHTDNRPLGGTGRYRDNWELSQGRALSVVRFMVDYLGIPANRLSANGFGEYQPINDGESPEALAQNRRIELKFTEK